MTAEDRAALVADKWKQVGNPRIRGRCPSCGADSLFLGNNGYVTCGVIGCKDPAAATDLLTNPRNLLADHARLVQERDEAAERATVMELLHVHEKARADHFEQELEGDGSCSADPVKSLGLRKCLELQRDTIARLEQELEVTNQIGDSFWEALKALDLKEIQVSNPGRHVTGVIQRAEAAEARLSALLSGGYTRHKSGCAALCKRCGGGENDCNHEASWQPGSGVYWHHFALTGKCTCGLDALQTQQDLHFDVVVNGQPTQVIIRASANVRDVIEPALTLTNTVSLSQDEWEVRLTEGTPIELDQPIWQYVGQRLWVNLRAGYVADALQTGAETR